MNLGELLELSTAQGKVITFVNETKVLSDNVFLSAVCMILEEGCKQRGLDVEEMADMVSKMVHEINAEHGKY